MTPIFRLHSMISEYQQVFKYSKYLVAKRFSELTVFMI